MAIHSELNGARNLDQMLRRLVWQLLACSPLYFCRTFVPLEKASIAAQPRLAVGLLLLLCSSAQEESLPPWEQFCMSVHPSFGEICLGGAISRRALWTVLPCSYESYKVNPRCVLMFSYPYCCLSDLGDLRGRQSTACNREQIHSKFSEAMERRRDPYGAGGTAQHLLKLETRTWSSGWDQDWRNGFFSPWQSRHGTGWVSKLLLYTTREESGPSIISLLNQNFKAKANGMYALLGYYPPHCYLGSNRCQKKTFPDSPSSADLAKNWRNRNNTVFSFPGTGKSVILLQKWQNYL